MKKITLLGMLIASLFLCSAQVKISALPAASTPSGTEVLPCVQSAITKKVTLNQIKTFVKTGVYNCDSIAECGNDLFWSLTGSSGTNPSTNFIGTTDGAGVNLQSGAIVTAYDSHIYLFKATDTTAGQILLNVIDSSGNSFSQIDLGDGNQEISLLQSNFNQDTFSYLHFFNDSIEVKSTKTTFAGSVKIVDGTQGVGKVLTSDANGLASWDTTSFTPLDSVSIYAITPTNGTTFFCTNCTGSAVTGRIVSFFGGLWRRLKFD